MKRLSLIFALCTTMLLSACGTKNSTLPSTSPVSLQELTPEHYSIEKAKEEGWVVVTDSYILEESISIWEDFLKKVETEKTASVRIYAEFELDNTHYQHLSEVSYSDGLYTYTTWKDDTQEYISNTYQYCKTLTVNDTSKLHILTNAKDITWESYFEYLITSVYTDDLQKKYEDYSPLELLFSHNLH